MKPTPVKNIVAEISLKRSDAFLPIFEPVINAINSILLKYPGSPSKGKISINIERDLSTEKDIFNPYPIKSVIIIDNGQGFSNENVVSFETPHSHKNKSLGCKGMGRFTCLAAFQFMEIESHFEEKGHWQHVAYVFDQVNEFQKKKDELVNINEFTTSIKLNNYYNTELHSATSISLDEFAEKLMDHCLIYYLDKKLPQISISEKGVEQIKLSDKYEELSSERERTFIVNNISFKSYLVWSTNRSRRYHYVHYCANSREVGEGKSLANVNNIFAYPIIKNTIPTFLNVYIVSDYLDKKVNVHRNTFSIPQIVENGLELNTDLAFETIEEKLSEILEDEFQEELVDARNRSLLHIKEHISNNGRQYKRFLHREDLLKKIPAFADETTIEEHLHKFAYKEIQSVEKSLKSFISSEKIDEKGIKIIEQQLKQKTAYDSDGLAEYMLRRRAILDLFDKFLEADEKGDYKLEEDIHNLIIPMGVSGDPSEIGHNLWLLDERFLSYNFVSSDIPITSISQEKSRLEPDVIMWQDGVNILDKPVAFGSSSSGEVQSLVIFEFKRPGQTAHQRSKGDKNWMLSELIEKYFDAFLYGDGKQNYKGKAVKIEKTTPKFGYIIIDRLPKELEAYNIDKGFKKTPYGTLFLMNDNLNLYIEVISFHQLINFARTRHQPFFDRLFGA